MNAIEMKNVNKAYTNFTLQNINLSLPVGCIMGLVGENGAGKSTTIKLIMNAVKNDGGEIEVFGQKNTLPSFTQAKQDIGIVLDEAYYPEILNAKQVNSIMKNTYKRWQEECYFNYIKRFSLPLDKPLKDYSRGMKMKLAISVALSHESKLLILDEATSGLDPIVRDEMLDIFNEFTRDENHSILISSHITSDLEKICDYIAFIHEGKLVFCKEKDRLHEEYGIIRTTKEEMQAINSEQIIGFKDNGYFVEILVKRGQVPSQFSVENASIEEIMLFFVKGVNK